MLLNTAPKTCRGTAALYVKYCSTSLFFFFCFESQNSKRNLSLKEDPTLQKKQQHDNPSYYNKVQVSTFWKPKAVAWKIGLFYNLMKSLKLDRTAETYETMLWGVYSKEGFKQSCCDGHWISVGTRRTASLLIQFAAQKTMKTDLNKWFGEPESSTKGKKRILYHHTCLNLIMEGHRIWLVVWVLSEMDCVPLTSTHLYTNMPTSWPNVVYQSWFMENKAI